jgi:hypothetical protein
MCQEKRPTWLLDRPFMKRTTTNKLNLTPAHILAQKVEHSQHTQVGVTSFKYSAVLSNRLSDSRGNVEDS